MLHRAAPPEAAALARAPGERVVVEEGRLATEQGRFAISRWVPGWDADALAQQRIGPRALAQLLREVVRGLAEAQAVGVGHGALDGACLRVTPSGRVWVLGFRGRGDDDLDALFQLAEGWREAADHGPDPLLEVLRAGSGSLSQAEARLTEVVAALEGPTLGEWVRSLSDPQPALLDHPLRGAVLAEAPPTPPMPAKVRVAGTAAVTLLLGLLTGAILFGAGPVEQAEMSCGEHTVSVRGAQLQVEAPGCAVEIRPAR